MQVEVLARAHALLAQTGMVGWSHIEMSAMKPFHPGTFWKHANTLYRHFTVFFLAHALKVLHHLHSSLHLNCCILWSHTQQESHL